MNNSIMDRSLKKSDILIIGCTVLIVACAYIITSKMVYGIGFPLDDAWIHQTYARNFAETGRWEYNPGKLSGGSTSPLWSTIISFGYLLNISNYFWTFLIAGLCLLLVGVVFQKIINSEIINSSLLLPLGGMFIAGEWHMVWAMLSGMETLSFILVIFLIFFILKKTEQNWWLIGILLGISVWLRPDGLSLLGPVFFILITAKGKILKKFTNFLKIFPGLISFVLIYFWFNYQLSGSIMPNTFYAKQLEYAVLLHEPFSLRLFNVIKQPFIGPGILLLPGMLYEVYTSIREINWWKISAFTWVFTYLAMYSFLLPVTYQHGRYEIPAMPVIYLLSFIGAMNIIKSYLGDSKFYILRTVWLLSILISWLGFNIGGAWAYSHDVAIIETEMVKTAKWINQNTDSGSKIAAHDIGALGFFGKREIVDMAGLITPEIIPFINNEEKLGLYLDQKNVNYLMTFSDWYPNLIEKGNEIYRSDSRFSPDAGGGNMIVIKWVSK